MAELSAKMNEKEEETSEDEKEEEKEKGKKEKEKKEKEEREKEREREREKEGKREKQEEDEEEAPSFSLQDPGESVASVVEWDALRAEFNEPMYDVPRMIGGKLNGPMRYDVPRVIGENISEWSSEYNPLFCDDWPNRDPVSSVILNGAFTHGFQGPHGLQQPPGLSPDIFDFEDINAHLSNGSTLLIEAIQSHSLQRVEQLLELGADPSLKKKELNEREGLDAYEYAFKGKNDSIAQRLFNYQHPETGETLFLRELKEGNLSRALAIATRNPNPLLERKGDGCCAVEFAFQLGSRQILEHIFHYRNDKIVPLLNLVLVSIIECTDPERLKVRIGRWRSLLEFGALWTYSKSSFFEQWEPLTLQLLESLPPPLQAEVASIFEKKRAEYHSFPHDETFSNYLSRSMIDAPPLTTENSKKWLSDTYLTQKTQGLNSFWCTKNVESSYHGNPSAPIYHPHQNPVSGVVLAVSLPPLFLWRLPWSIRQIILSRHQVLMDSVDLFVVIQSMEEAVEDDRVLFRPHYWMDPFLPEEFEGVRFSKISHLSIVRLEESEIKSPRGERRKPANPQPKTFMAKNGEVLPQENELNYVTCIPTRGAGIWSVTVDSDSFGQPNRCAVTLHWFLSHNIRDEMFDRLEMNAKEGLSAFDAFNVVAGFVQTNGLMEVLENWFLDLKEDD